MNHTERNALISEGKSIIERTDEDSWRLAQIVSELHADGMTYQNIGTEFGWTSPDTAHKHDVAFTSRRKHDTFSEALLYAGMSEDRATAVQAVAEAEGIAPHTAKSRQSAKEIAAAISNLPADQKAEVARELAQDAAIAIEGANAVAKSLDEKRKTHRREHGPTKEIKTSLDGALTISTLDLLAHQVVKAEKDVKQCDGEALALAIDSIETIEASVRNMRATIQGSDVEDWDTAAEKELA